MIKLIQNELIKIFKRKSIYFLLILSVIGIIVYTNINPDQNEIYSISYVTQDFPQIEDSEKQLNDMDITEDAKYYITQKAYIECEKLNNKYEKGSWQRYALEEERTGITVPNVYTDYNKDIRKSLENIFDYELNPNTETTKEVYESSKTKYSEYVKALDSNDWKEFVNLKIKNLEERKNNEELSKEEIEEINLEIEVYNLRLNNNINFNSDALNGYIQQYKENYYVYKGTKLRQQKGTDASIEKNIASLVGRINICKYAIENNINKDISNKINMILDNKIDARISFIRTFKHFDLIIVIIAIYISTTIVTEEVNKKTIKNLLTKPHKRSKILISKILASIITIIVSMLVVILAQYIIGGIKFGFDSYSLGYIDYDVTKECVININLFKFIFLEALSKLPMYIMIIVFCIFIGTINNHTSMSMILTLIIFIISSTAIREWSKVVAFSKVSRYFITNNWDFSVYLFGNFSDIEGVTLIRSLIIYFVYLLVFLFLATYKFNKKEINNVQ